MTVHDFSNSFFDADHIPNALPRPVANQRPAICLMVLGTSSGAGKSWLATALCAFYRACGFRVAPFKAQNMSANARPALLHAPLTPDTTLPRFQAGSDTGSDALGLISAAQHLQALAAGRVPEVRMNPLLLVPTADMRSMVYLMGQPRSDIAALPWRARAPHVWPAIVQALDDLRADNDIVIIEGAGSPAEVNLHDSDVVNMRIARHCQAHCLLVADIDRGGAFAHLLGTWAALDAPDQRLLRGFVLNKFRGDARLLAPAPQWLHSRTGVPTVAIVPLQADNSLPEEDSLGTRPSSTQRTADLSPEQSPPHARIAIVELPRMSCHDEFAPLLHLHSAALHWVRHPRDVGPHDWLIVPGSAHLDSDLAWLRAQGLDAAITAHARAGQPVLGIAQGAHMLGEALICLNLPENPAMTPPGSKAPSATHLLDGNAPGLGLLPLVTVRDAHSACNVRTHTLTLPTLRGPWAGISTLPICGWSEHSAHTQLRHDIEAHSPQRSTEPITGLIWQNPTGNVLGIGFHGLFETADVLAALWPDPHRAEQRPHSLQNTFTAMARALPQWFAALP